MGRHCAVRCRLLGSAAPSGMRRRAKQQVVSLNCRISLWTIVTVQFWAGGESSREPVSGASFFCRARIGQRRCVDVKEPAWQVPPPLYSGDLPFSIVENDDTSSRPDVMGTAFTGDVSFLNYFQAGQPRTARPPSLLGFVIRASSARTCPLLCAMRCSRLTKQYSFP
ncbi:hypothetical protein LZ30DRAFT_804944 [Colletotrichum cereale]|nr:hypothetical protein LZ30DRAFT_804944 [Colletotrichum cereale]